MSKPERATSGTDRMRTIKVRGRPINEASRAALIAEIERLNTRVANLEATVIMQNGMWREAMKAGAMQGNPADYRKEAAE